MKIESFVSSFFNVYHIFSHFESSYTIIVSEGENMSIANVDTYLNYFLFHLHDHDVLISFTHSIVTSFLR